ncbi:hypothetical protein D8682_04145 [Buttiauxella sp. 3AFRM03]|uniref:LuxR C-terminal-related transcriptional regulator n=1 Tax=Buttiauxella sp. 3AFRM03 TaxID=2479367 RepID=UPI000EF7E82F|nr:LuxR C-terminal-related transcriptional regulator [Buttiauxella sp. 3AFRM03]AYN26259.1 hypothetical protein D8682_04145 [Buttiauxella sp. 3AFRM03]
MLKIVIDEQNVLYRHGLEMLLKQIFSAEMNVTVEIVTLNETNIATADIIFKNYDVGVSCICQPLLHTRRKNSLVIGLYEGSKNPRYAELPLCITDIAFVNRAEPVNKTKTTIMRGWEDCRAAQEQKKQWSCLDCRHRTLSPQQVKIAAHFYRGDTTEKIASDLQINPKTVGAHKRMIMTKFNLNTDFELLTFLNNLLKEKRTLELFNQSLEAN